MAFTTQQVAVLEKQAEDSAKLTRAQARKFLLKAGIITPKGQLTKKFRDARPSPKPAAKKKTP